MKPNEDTRELSRDKQTITSSDELHKVVATWRAIVEHLNPYDPNAGIEPDDAEEDA